MIVENEETDKLEAEQPCHHDYNDETKEDIFLKNNLNVVDLYQTYEKDNINDSRNIYKNKLIINNNRQNEKYEDKYVHMSYDNNYLYDNHTNNIYTDENISNYILQQNNILTNHKKGNEIKTYVNLCLNYYNNLDTCVIKKYEKNVQSKKYKYTRLHTCKPHYGKKIIDKKNSKNINQNNVVMNNNNNMHNNMNNNKIIQPYKMPMYNPNAYPPHPFYMNNNFAPYNNMPPANAYQNNFFDKNMALYNNSTKNIY
ncbi:hypothetical protein PFMALIP_05764, partial [Plasmodium falciparum MaliPS096_E11]